LKVYIAGIHCRHTSQEFTAGERWLTFACSYVVVIDEREMVLNSYLMGRKHCSESGLLKRAT
ncbi:MAG TPA: hypothetical protein PK309_03765, partial [Bacillota bacterium]|nr:hypothetical protein [Bacillota bacterium]